VLCFLLEIRFVLCVFLCFEIACFCSNYVELILAALNVLLLCISTFRLSFLSLVLSPLILNSRIMLVDFVVRILTKL
jgi:hypothetical protein